MAQHVITYHPKELLELQAELMHPFHTKFNQEFSQRPRPFDEVLSDLCTYFNIVVDGTYSPEDQLALAAKVTGKLAAQRMTAVEVVKH